MKVLFVTDTMHPGGSERVISVLANEFCSLGIDTGIFCFRQKESFYKLDERVFVHYASVETGNASIFRRALWLRQLCIREQVDVVIPFMTAVYCLTICSLLGTRIPIIASERIDPTTTPFGRKVLRWTFLRFTTRLVVQTESIKSYYSKSLQKRCSVIYNPVNDSFFELPEAERIKRFVNVGRLSEQKNQKMLIDAFSSISREFPKYTLSIFGDGELRDELEQYIKSHHLEGKVVLEGTSNRLAYELNSSYAFCLSSNYEGMSNAVLEALCVGLPVITTDVSGIKEIIADDENGYVVPVGDTDSLARAMRKLASDGQLVDTMRNRNRDKGRAMFCTKSIVSDWLDLINDVVR